MPLPPGARLGAYEIRSLLGQGGMGEVYRARDPRLMRDVAVKVLPSHFASDSDRLRRFRQEALAAAQLNHPNILAVYDVGTDDGPPFLVSELLEGVSLRERLNGGALPPRRAVDVGIQIANGLAAAHDHGIVHRDLKPENVFLTSDGHVKILDFGLAKLAGVEPSACDSSTLPTKALGTEVGQVVGTAGYMSPEQARGHTTDTRTDIFSFGAILYEMLSGRRAFAGDTHADTISAILNTDPPDITASGSPVTAALDRVVRYCLEKDPGQRFQSARDVSLALRAASDVHTNSSTLPAAPRAWKALPIWITALVGAVALAGFLAGRTTAVQPSVPAFQRLTFRRGSVTTARFAAGGGSILYAAAWEGAPLQVFSTRAENPESRVVVEGSTDLLAVSPAAAEMALLLNRRRAEPWVGSGMLARTALDGGTPRPVLGGVQWADWSPKGDLAVVRDQGGENRLEWPVGHVLARSPGYISHPRFSPSGDAVAFVDHRRRISDGGFVRIVAVDGRVVAQTALWASVWGLAWASDSEVWFTAAEIGSARDLQALARSGKERLVAHLLGPLTLQDVSADHQVLLTRDDQRLGIVGRAAGEARERDLSWFDFSALRDLSRDGRQILFDESGDAGGARGSVYLRATDGSPAVRLGDGGAFCFAGTDHVLAIVVADPAYPFVLLPTGPGEPRIIRTPSSEPQSIGCFADGKRFVEASSIGGSPPRLYVRSLADGTGQPLTGEGVTLVPGSDPIAPDDSAIIGRAGDGRFRTYPVNGGAPRVLDTLPAGFVPIGWAPDGRGLYVYQPGELPAVVSTWDLATGALHPLCEVRLPDPSGVQFIRPPHLRLDGKMYAFSYLRYLSDLYLAKGLR